MENWTLKYQGVEKTLAEWGITSLKRSVINPGEDTVTFNQIGEAIEAFEAEALLSIWCGGVRWFEGLVTRTPGYTLANGSRMSYEVKGPFWYLENTVYQQIWQEATCYEVEDIAWAPVYKGRVVLGQNKAGEPIRSAEAIADIAAYAIRCGAPFVIGTIEADYPLPMDELRDVSCAEALARVLRFAPDAVVSFDYHRKGHPVLNIRQRAHATPLSLHLTEDKLKRFAITPRHDRVAPAVILKYEKVHRVGSHTWATTEIEAYPEGVKAEQPKAIVLTLELAGLRAHELKQVVKTAPILPDSGDWWARHLPSLGAIKEGSLVVKNPQRQSILPDELIGGAIAEWMNCEVEEDIVRATLAYETLEGTAVEHPVAVRLQATSAIQKTYTHCLADSMEETPPVGLAKALYEAVATLAYEGEVALCGSDYLNQSYLGKTLCIKGGKPEWEAMGALIQAVTYQLETGDVVLKFGPVGLLGTDDLVELFRANRDRRPVQRAPFRALGRSSSRQSIKQATHARLENTDRGVGHMKRLVLSETEKTGAIVLDMAALPENAQVELREETVCHNGVLLKRLVLASKPYAR